MINVKRPYNTAEGDVERVLARGLLCYVLDWRKANFRIFALTLTINVIDNPFYCKFAKWFPKSMIIFYSQ